MNTQKKAKRLKPHKPLSTKDAIGLAGNRRRLAEALGITIGAVHQWGEYPPIERQDQIRQLYGVKS